jgi:hypothetical protein
MNRNRLTIATLCIGVLAALDAGQANAEPIHWQVNSTPDGWRLLRDGEPFYIEGAVAPNRFDVLRARGGNAVRVNATRPALDAAQAAGLAVMANLPVRGERNQLDWNNEQQVSQQQDKVLAIVRELKDHPAIMFWSVGNELDHIPGNQTYNPRIWTRLNDLAVAIKQLDEHHPVMTVVGTGRFERKIQEIAADCRDMDLLGINAYGDIQRACELARRHWPKPYVVSEWGPTGHWEVPRTKWRAPIEQSSSEKAKVIGERYQHVIQADRTHCLGSFVFYWSEKQETTHTWYGLFCTGLSTESLDVMQRLWTGAWPANRAPLIVKLQIQGCTDPRAAYLQRATAYRAEVESTDPDSDPLAYAWDIRPEVVIPPGSYAGGLETRVQPIPGLIPNSTASAVEFTTPDKPGPFRLFVAVTDGQGHVAYGNVPFYVEE